MLVIEEMVGHYEMVVEVLYEMLMEAVKVIVVEKW